LIRPGDIPEPLIQGLAELIATGTAGQRISVLSFAASFLEFPKNSGRAASRSLSDGDPKGQAEVLEAFNSHDIALPIDRFGRSAGSARARPTVT
jgi:hypothetical protein